jgi:ubiquinone biosynthesis protein
MGRLAEISRVFLEEGLALSKPEDSDDAEARAYLPQTDKEKARRLRRALSRLGPTFVKFGQLLSMRLDLFSPEFLQELGQLRSRVPPFPSQQAREIIEAELGKPVEELFSEFPEKPVASASMAQVYRSRLRDSGQTVAVKVIRPLVRETLERDLEIIIDISKTLDRLLPVYRRSMVHQVAIEYATRARKESEFLLEAHAMTQFEAVTESVPEFVVPKVYLTLCSRGVLTMEWLDGTLLDTIEGRSELEAMGFDPKALARSLLRLQLVMSYEHGFVHGDTHAGNLFLLEQGRIGIIDFGLHGQVSRKLCDQMIELLFYQASGRTPDAVRAFGRIFGAHKSENREAFERELTEILRAAPEEASRNPLTSQLVEGLRLGAKYQLKAQSELFLVLRNLTIVEGIVLTYCPEIDFVDEASEILRQIMTRRALQGLSDPGLSKIAPLLLLNAAKHPELMQALLRLARSFSNSTDLGEFLESERVFERWAIVPHQSYLVPVIIGVLSALVTAIVLFLVLR